MEQIQTMDDFANTIMSAGMALTRPRSPVSALDNDLCIDTSKGTPYVVMPEGAKLEDLERLLPAPARKRASVVVSDSASFIFYTKKHGSMDECVIYAAIDSEKSYCNLVAVINDNGADNPKWRDHRCTFAPKLAVEWSRWIGKNKIAMPQADFATWLEDNLPDIASVDGMPTGAQILAMALGFEANSNKKLRSKLNLQSGGYTLEFVDEENNDTRTSMQVFERFTLGLPVFDGSTSAYPLEARLKYRENQGKLTFWYELIRPDRVFKTAVVDELNLIKEGTGFPIISGKPE